MPSAVATALQRHPGAGHQRLQEHIAGTGGEPIAAGGRMQPGFDQGPTGVELAGEAFAQPAGGTQRHHRRLRAVAILLLQRGLKILQGLAVHSRLLYQGRGGYRAKKRQISALASIARLGGVWMLGKVTSGRAFGQLCVPPEMATLSSAPPGAQPP